LRLLLPCCITSCTVEADAGTNFFRCLSALHTLNGFALHVSIHVVRCYICNHVSCRLDLLIIYN